MGFFKAKKIDKHQANNVQNHEPILSIPGSKVHLMDQGEAIELANGDFTLVHLTEDNTLLATIVKVGDNLQWPLTKDEPVVKLDPFHYIFSLHVKDGNPLSYGVSFSDPYNSEILDNFLSENACFSATSLVSSSTNNKEINWKEYAPNVEEYNNFLAKAIAGGTGQIIKGIFILSNAYANQVHKGGEIFSSHKVDENNNVISASYIKGENQNGVKKKSMINKNIKRVRKLSKLTERLSKAVLNGVEMVTRSTVAPVAKSRLGKTLLKLPPAEAILASFAALDMVLDAAEAASKQALSATTSTTTEMVSKRYGKDAGEATEDAIETARHCACTCWNIFKLRKAINPASAVNSGFLKNAAKSRRSSKSKR